ncbi:MAG TPA: TatD family hydrolase, partial [Candidatus Binataceae bacterium]|nr:TatD family hydrolase [Candidatus Binataceae bacterium]
MIEIVDTHCHLADQRLRGEVDALLARARESRVTRVISVGAIDSIETDRLTVEIAEGHEQVFAAIGIHPHDAKDLTEERLAALRDLARS